jgi:deoxyhypusine synthase
MKFTSINPRNARVEKLATLSRLVRREQLARPLAAGASVRDFLDALPNIYAARDLRVLAQKIARARRSGRVFLLLSGAHPIKTGLGPLICELVRDKILSAIGCNGAFMIHDFELALAGRTSEDVGAGLAEGRFGMADETGSFLSQAAASAAHEGTGLGEVVGREISRRRLKHRESSVLACAYEQGVPVTVHVALGADIVHMHPQADGAAIGQASMNDFHRLTAVVSRLARGVVLNLGSAVIMPEVFLKALNLARNLGAKVDNFTAADMDFVRHYRPRVNVVERPTAGGGQGILLTGHHELMFPLLCAAIGEEIGPSERLGKRRGGAGPQLTNASHDHGPQVAHRLDKRDAKRKGANRLT